HASRSVAAVCPQRAVHLVGSRLVERDLPGRRLASSQRWRRQLDALAIDFQSMSSDADILQLESDRLTGHYVQLGRIEKVVAELNGDHVHVIHLGCGGQRIGDDERKNSQRERGEERAYGSDERKLESHRKLTSNRYRARDTLKYACGSTPDVVTRQSLLAPHRANWCAVVLQLSPPATKYVAIFGRREKWPYRALFFGGSSRR